MGEEAAASPKASASGASESGGYEFTTSEEGVVRALASTMRMAAMASLVLGVLHLAAGVMRLVGGRMLGGLEGLGTAVVAILASVWVRSAARSFQLVVDTKGNDIKNTLDAVAVLRKMFILGVAACIGLILLLAGGTVGGFMAHRAHEQRAPASAPESAPAQ